MGWEPGPPDRDARSSGALAMAQGRSAFLVGAGIFITRILGFVRERVFAHYFGNGAAADAFRAALRIPNVIRNLLGEGTLSASFIPVYAGLLEKDAREDARQLAGVIASLLVLLTAVAALGGILLAPVITDVVAPGFDASRRELTVRLVEIMFPMSGVLILSAWCLGILNTHGRFFLAYAAPAVWNVTQIVALLALGGVLASETRLIVVLAWSALVGSVLQLAIQLPTTLGLVRRIWWSMDLNRPGVRSVIRAWLPVIVGAGAYQISSIVDTQLASLLVGGSVAVLGYAQLVALLPVSLFGVSVAAAALPALSRDVAADARDVLAAKLSTATRRMAYFVLPAALGIGLLAEEIIGALFQTGAFGRAETITTAGVLAAYSIAIPGQASVKLFASGHYALGDTMTPVRIAIGAVVLSAVTAFVLMQSLGPAGIALGAAVGATVNMVFNLSFLQRRLGSLIARGDGRHLIAGLAAATLAGAVARAAAHAVAGFGNVAAATVGVATMTLAYGGMTVLLAHPEARSIASRFGKRS